MGSLLWWNKMNEQEWLSCTDPIRMLELLGNTASGRKMRLFVAHGVRILESIFGEEQVVLAELHERVAEGEATEEDLERFLLRGMPELWEHRAPGGNLPSVWQTARMVVRDRIKLAPVTAKQKITPRNRDDEKVDMCRVLRCIFGNPCRPVTIDPAWLTPTVVSIAQGIYDDRAFDRLSILADALEEAGSDNHDILNHLRGSGAHTRGCWCIDLLLAKE